MVEKKTVSVNWQTLFMVIPVIDLWATYRIEKLRLYLLVLIAMLVVEFLGVALIFPDNFEDYYLSVELSDEHLVFAAVVIVVKIGISIVLIRMWTKEWNSKITENS